ncbi:MAG TPA: YggT family protein [Gemmatimonadales bacterium]|jgi:uncharacterized protein YggT (Ycf19 family)
MEERRVTHQQVTSRVEYEVDPSVRTLTDEPVVIEPGAERLAELRERTLREAEATENAKARGRVVGRIGLAVDFLFFLVYALLGIRLVLALLNARQDAPFTQWIYGVSEPLYAPFRGLLPNLTTEAGFTLALPLVFALLVYALLHAAIRRLLRVFSARPVVV